MVEKLGDEKREDHKELWEAIKKTNETVAALAVAVGKLSGKFVGYIAAGTILGGGVAALAGYLVKHIGG